MKYIKIVALFMMAITALAVMSSCEKDEANSADMLAYIRLHKAVPTMTLNCIYQPDGSVNIANSAKQTTGKFAFEAGLAREAVKHTQINVALDASLVEGYNAANNTQLVAINEDAISFDSQAVIDLYQGVAAVYDTVTIDFTKLEPSKSYLIPIRIKSVQSNDKGVVVSTNTSTIFTRVTTGVANNIDASADVPTGTLIDRTGWIVTASDSNAETNGPTNMLDNSNTSIWLGKANTLSSFILDCGSEKAVKAFKLTTVSGNLYGRNPKNMSVEGSNDGTTWVMFGTSPQLPRPASATAATIENYITMVFPQKYRYYRLKVTAHWLASSGSGVAELNAIE